MGILASTHKAPSFSWGRNSVPNQRVEKIAAIKQIPAIIRESFLFENVHEKLLATVLLTNRVKKFSFSFTFFFSISEHKRGTRVNVNISAPNKANPKVQARGENIFPSTFS